MKKCQPLTVFLFRVTLPAMNGSTPKDASETTGLSKATNDTADAIRRGALMPENTMPMSEKVVPRPVVPSAEITALQEAIYDLLPATLPHDQSSRTARGIVRYLIHSDWLADEKAKAWDAGESAGFNAHQNYSDTKPANPYIGPRLRPDQEGN